MNKVLIRKERRAGMATMFSFSVCFGGKQNGEGKTRYIPISISFVDQVCGHEAAQLKEWREVNNEEARWSSESGLKG